MAIVLKQLVKVHIYKAELECANASKSVKLARRWTRRLQAGDTDPPLKIS